MSDSPRISELPKEERPRERLAARGPGSLSDAEILALFFGSGLPGISAIDLGRILLERFGSLRGIAGANMAELSTIKGIGPAKSTQLAAVFEFGKRLARERTVDRAVDSPEAVYELLGSEMAPLNQESLRVILLNTRHRLIRITEITKGSLNESIAHPREILREAIVHSAYAYILVHNHPSGDPAPSEADRRLTRRMQAASREVGIEMIDHIIIGAPPEHGGDPFFSFAETGFIA